jgi:hypothetical protein
LLHLGQNLSHVLAGVPELLSLPISLVQVPLQVPHTVTSQNQFLIDALNLSLLNLSFLLGGFTQSHCLVFLILQLQVQVPLSLHLSLSV